jgi:hypothetical protein
VSTSAAVSLAGGFGDYAISVALQDAAGNYEAARSAVWNVRYLAPAPTPAPAPATPAPSPSAGTGATPAPALLPSPRLAVAEATVARDRHTITVRGSVASGVRGRVAIKASAKIGRRTRSVNKTVTIRSRRYSAKLRLPSTSWRTAKVTVHYAGSAARRAQTVTRTVRQRTR